MTTAYTPTSQWHAEDLRDAAIDQLADALDTLRIAQDKYQASDWLADDLAELISTVHESTQRALAVSRIVVRRHQLLNV